MPSASLATVLGQAPSPRICLKCQLESQAPSWPEVTRPPEPAPAANDSEWLDFHAIRPAEPLIRFEPFEVRIERQGPIHCRRCGRFHEPPEGSCSIRPAP